MARPVKKGLDYFPLDVNIFENEKVAAVSGEFQLKGEIILIKLLCAIYRNGYFYEWSEMNQMHLLRQLPTVTPGLLQQVVNRLVKWDFFDKNLFDSSQVLTSASIQERYFTAISRRKVTGKDYPYLLVNVDNNPINVRNNPVQTELMFTESTQIKRKEIKTPLNPPASGAINRGFSKEEEDISSSVLSRKTAVSGMDNRTIPRIPQEITFTDGVERNYKGLLEQIRNYPPDAQAQIILLSNYGEIGHPVWGLFHQIVNSGGKIKLPAQFVLSRLRNHNS